MKKILLTATVQSHICQFHRPLVEMLRENGECEIHVAARDNLAEKNGLKLDFADKVFNIPFSRSPFNKNNITAYKQLKKIIEEENYDIIHCNTPSGGVVTRLAAKKVRKKGAGVYYTAHGFHFYCGASKKNWMIYYPIEKFFARYTDKLITINNEDYELAKKKFGCKIERIHGVGVDGERYRPGDEEEIKLLKSKLGYPEDSRIILCVGELLPNKNQKMVIAAMAEVVKKFPCAILLLAGNGPEKENLEEFIRTLNLDNNVKLIGYCTNLEEYQRISDMSVSCSKREGLGLNLIEAMLSENPVIGTENRGHSELITSGENGYLIKQSDVTKLYENIVKILADKDESCKMGSCGRNFALKYEKQSVKKELQQIYFPNSEEQ